MSLLPTLPSRATMRMDRIEVLVCFTGLPRAPDAAVKEASRSVRRMCQASEGRHREWWLIS